MTPVYIVTGATGGIGKAIVQMLAEEHAPCHIILAVRSVERGNAVARTVCDTSRGVSAEARRLDLASFDSVVAFAKSIISDGYAISALFNNAGIMPGGVTVTDDGLELATQTNFVSTALLTHMLLPVISDGGAIHFTTSVTRHLPRLHSDWAQRAISHHQRFVTYGRSKLMLTHYALELSHRLASRGIRVNCSDPGVADTGIISMGNRVVDFLADRLVRPFMHTPRQGAQPALRAVFADRTGTIFTAGGCSDIPQHWYGTNAHRELIEALEQYFHRYENFA